MCPTYTYLRLTYSNRPLGIERSKKYVEGSDKDFLAGFFVMSINEWKVFAAARSP